MTADCGPQQHEQEEDWGVKLVHVAGVVVEVYSKQGMALLSSCVFKWEVTFFIGRCYTES